MTRPPMLGMVYWDLENRATLHLLFVLWDLWPNNKDGFMRIFYRMFPRFQRARCVMGHLRDHWQQRWQERRGAVDFRAIDRPNSYRAANLNQAELNDLATLRAIVELWAAHLGITLTTNANPTRATDGHVYNFAGGVPSPTYDLNVFVNQFTGGRTALLPGDDIPEDQLDEMTDGCTKININKTKVKILPIKFGMAIEGLETQLENTVGVDVDEEGNALDDDGEEEEEEDAGEEETAATATAPDPSSPEPEEPEYFECEKCGHPRQNDLRAREGYDHCQYCISKWVDRDIDTEREWCIDGNHDTTRLQFCYNEDLFVDETLEEHPRRCVMHASLSRAKRLPKSNPIDDPEPEDEDLYGATDNEGDVDEQDDEGEDQDIDSDEDFTLGRHSASGGKAFPPRFTLGGKAPPSIRPARPVNAPRKTPASSSNVNAPRKSTHPRKAVKSNAPRKSTSAPMPSKKRRVQPTPVLTPENDPRYVVKKVLATKYLIKKITAEYPEIDLSTMTDEEFFAIGLGPSRQTVSYREAAESGLHLTSDDENDGAGEQGEDDVNWDEYEMQQVIEDSVHSAQDLEIWDEAFRQVVEAEEHNEAMRRQIEESVEDGDEWDEAADQAEESADEDGDEDYVDEE